MPLRSAARYDHASERKASDTLPADLLARIKRKEIGRLGDYEVWAVDGRLIRDEVDTDWVEGGNPSRYGYQPEHELWVEGPVPEHGANALHEFLEARDMASGTDYETAHDKATKAERAFRSEHPTGDLVDAREFLDRWIDEDLAAPKPKRKPRARKFTKRQIEQRRAAGRARWAGVSKEEHAAVSRKGLAAAKGIPPPEPGEACATCGTVRDESEPTPVVIPTPTGIDPSAIAYSHTSKPSENKDEPGTTYDVTATAPDGKVIGAAYFGEYDGALRSGETEVDPAWRRKGIAMGMYDYLEKITGRTVEPSPVLSEDAKAFWDARRARKGEKAPKMAGIPRTSHAGDFASKTLAVASGIGPEGRWGSDRVYLASLYETLPEPRPDRAIWEQGLLGAARSGALRLAGGEYVGDMDASLYRLSEVHDGPRALRFLVTPSRPVGVHPPT